MQEGRDCSEGTWYKPQIDSFHVFRNPSGHGSQGAKRAVDLAGNVTGARVRTGQRGARVSPEENQHHGECSPLRPRWHLVGVGHPRTPVVEPQNQMSGSASVLPADFT